MRDPLLAPAVAFVAGILLSHGVRFGLWEAAILAVTFAAFAFVTRRALILVYAAVMFAGVFVDVWHRPGRTPFIDAGSREIVLLSGCVVEPTSFYQDRDQFTIEMAPHARARVSIALHDGETPPEISYGRLVEVEARVRPIRNFNNPGSFDFVSYSARRSIYWTASARSAESVRVLPGICGSTFLRGIFALRTAALKQIESLYRNNAYATGMMESILIGETTKLDKIWTDHFRRTGTFHALVISGLHIIVLASSLRLLLRLCFVRDLPALGITAVTTWIYVLVAGWNPPAVRAAGAFTMYLAGRYFYRERRMMNLLAVVGIVYLACDPAELFEAAFQLSFLSVAAIAVLAVPVLEKTSSRYRRALIDLGEIRRDLRIEPCAAQFRIELRLLAETLAYFVPIGKRAHTVLLSTMLRACFFAYELIVVSTVMQVGLALPMAIYFHRISFSGFSANVIIVPLLSLVVPIGFVAIFSGLPLAARLAEWLLVLSERAASWHLHGEPEWRIPDPPLWLSIGFAAALIALAFTMRRSRAWRWSALGAVMVLFALVVSSPFPAKVRPGALEMTAIDVGQGDSLLVGFPNGKLMLVDGGGVLAFGRKTKPKLDIGEDVVSPYLWSRSVRHLDVVVATHAHEDHTGGLRAVVDNFHPQELWTGANTDEPVWRDLSQHARAHGVKIVARHAGEQLDFGGAKIEILSPPEDYVPNDTPKNNDSLAFRILYGRNSFLLTGDMEKPMETRLLADERPVHADVLKVGHHGSKTSTSEPFLDAVHPAFAIISDGFENSFGHPHGDVLARLSERHTETLRTDTVGLITVRSDGRRISVETW